MMKLGDEAYALLDNRSRYTRMVRAPVPGISQIRAPATNNPKLTRPSQPRWIAGRWHRHVDVHRVSRGARDVPQQRLSA